MAAMVEQSLCIAHQHCSQEHRVQLTNNYAEYKFYHVAILPPSCNEGWIA